MKDFFHTLKFKILIVLVSLVLGIMLYAATTGGNDSLISSAFGKVLSPLQKFSFNISNKVTSTLDMFFDSKEHRDENVELKKKLDDLYLQMVDYEKLLEENENYKELLELKETYNDVTFSAPASIIGRKTNDIFHSFFIDKGSVDGISLYDPVVTDAGLVGFIDSVEKTYSRVNTILSSDFSLGVFCLRTKETAVAQGGFEFAKDGLLQIRFIPLESDIKPGDIITTSGHSGLVPKDRIVGIVQDVSIYLGGLSRVATVKPIVDVSQLKTVFVVTDFDGQGEGYAE